MRCCILLTVVVLMMVDHGQSKEVDVRDVIEKNLQPLATCFMGTTPCINKTSEAFKNQVLLDGIHNACRDCKPMHKVVFKAFLGGLKTKYPQDYEAFKQKFDPELKYLPALEAAVADAY